MERLEIKIGSKIDFHLNIYLTYRDWSWCIITSYHCICLCCWLKWFVLQYKINSTREASRAVRGFSYFELFFIRNIAYSEERRVEEREREWEKMWAMRRMVAADKGVRGGARYKLNIRILALIHTYGAMLVTARSSANSSLLLCTSATLAMAWLT